MKKSIFKFLVMFALAVILVVIICRMFLSRNMYIIDISKLSETVHNKYGYGDNVKIAVIDSGILEGQVVTNAINFSNDEDTTDYIGHGSIVLDIISNPNYGISPNAEVYMLKVINKYGLASTEAVYKALEWCKGNEIDIINMSLSFGIYSENVECMINALISDGTIIVSSINNSNVEVDFPSMYDGVICVGKTDNIELYNEDTRIILKSINSVKIGTEEYDGNSFLAPCVTGIIANSYNQKYERGNTNAELIRIAKLIISTN